MDGFQSCRIEFVTFAAILPVVVESSLDSRDRRCWKNTAERLMIQAFEALRVAVKGCLNGISQHETDRLTYFEDATRVQDFKALIT